MWSYAQEILDDINKYHKLLTGAVITTGIFVVFCYCAFIINFFPSGLTLGDSLIFIFIALGFGVLYFLWLGLGYLSVFGLTHPWHKVLGEKERFSPVFIGIASGAALFLSALTTGDTIKFLVSSLLSGFILLFAVNLWGKVEKGTQLEEKPTKENNRTLIKLRLAVIMMALFGVPILASPVVSKLISTSFKSFGISHDNVSLILDRNNYEIVEGVSKSLGVEFKGCILEGNKVRIVNNIKVLWHGIGDQSLIALIHNEGIKAKLELDSVGVALLKNFSEELKICSSEST